MAALDANWEFNAPSHYDFDHPEEELDYINNADGYFGGPRESLMIVSSAENSICNNLKIQSLKENQEVPTASQDILVAPIDEPDPAAVLDNQKESGDRAHTGEAVESQCSLQDELENVHPQQQNAVVNPPPVPVSSKTRVVSTLYRPTEASLARKKTILNAAQARRTRPDLSVKRPLTEPRGPNLRVVNRVEQRLRSGPPRISSTSKELEKIKEMKKLRRLEKQMIEKFRRSMETKGPHIPIAERSIKELTVPQSPKLSTTQRMRPEDLMESEPTDVGIVRAEDIVKRSITAGEKPPPSRPFHPTRAHSPHFSTSDRAKFRSPQRLQQEEDAIRKKRESAKHISEKTNRGINVLSDFKPTITKAQGPNLVTEARAKLHPTRIETRDEDGEELAKQFHALKFDPQHFANPKVPHRADPIPLTIAQSPALTTKVRARPVREPPAEPPVTFHARPVPVGSPFKVQREPVPLCQPQTPNLQSLKRHARYQEEFEAQRQKEEEQMKDKMAFKAQPMRIGAPFEPTGSDVPLTEFDPFSMPGDAFHKQAQDHLERTRRREEQLRKEQANVKAHALPNMEQAFVPARSSKPLTEIDRPALSSDIQAQRRREYDEKNKVRVAAENASRRQFLADKKKREDSELRRWRRNELTFKAKPIMWKGQAHTVRPSKKELTVPEGPSFLNRIQKK